MADEKQQESGIYPCAYCWCCAEPLSAELRIGYRIRYCPWCGAELKGQTQGGVK